MLYNFYNILTTSSLRQPRSNSTVTSAFRPSNIIINRHGKYVIYDIIFMLQWLLNEKKKKPLFDVINPFSRPQPPRHNTWLVNRNKLKSRDFCLQNIVKYTYRIVELDFIVFKCMIQGESIVTHMFLLMIYLFQL